jgi:hypothetical protein
MKMSTGFGGDLGVNRWILISSSRLYLCSSASETNVDPGDYFEVGGGVTAKNSNLNSK